MIHPDGTMDVIVDGVQKRRKFTIEKRVSHGCITKFMETPILKEGESMLMVTGKLPEITSKKDETQ